MLDSNIVVPSAAEVYLLNDIQTVMSVPHAAQESLSSEHTPTLSYSLPFYHAISDKWERLKQDYPLLSPYIEIGIQKVKGYIKKSRFSQTYLLAECESPLPSQVAKCS